MHLTMWQYSKNGQQYFKTCHKSSVLCWFEDIDVPQLYWPLQSPNLNISGTNEYWIRKYVQCPSLRRRDVCRMARGKFQLKCIRR
ncbi:hypothetical protein GDO78_018379 [Eleutherodactylus coqui]|uniref:Uncharacterized protein n=1 Tax=Eleutherodactylus coqui TaxID=57060 RepID=A0A8J6E5N9_ELECQ|nr:hypothetical protein GDO78_018379 [Eleutherodactylus coqui]